MSTTTLKFIETDSKLIETISSMTQFDGNNWYYMPCWYKKVGEGMYAQYSFDELPEGFKSHLKLLREALLPIDKQK